MESICYKGVGGKRGTTLEADCKHFLLFERYPLISSGQEIEFYRKKLKADIYKIEMESGTYSEPAKHSIARMCGKMMRCTPNRILFLRFCNDWLNDKF